MRDFDELASAYPFQYIVLTEGDDPKPFLTRAKAHEYKNSLGKPAIVGALTEKAARVVKSALRVKNTWWVDGVVVRHPECRPSAPFRAIIDTGFEEGVGFIPFDTYRALMEARIVPDESSYRGANSELSLQCKVFQELQCHYRRGRMGIVGRGRECFVHSNSTWEPSAGTIAWIRDVVSHETRDSR